MYEINNIEITDIVNQKEAGMEKEKCVRCGKETLYDQSTPVTVRRYFVEGAGQLCPDCWRKLYERENDTTTDRSDS